MGRDYRVGNYINKMKMSPTELHFKCEQAEERIHRLRWANLSIPKKGRVGRNESRGFRVSSKYVKNVSHRHAHNKKMNKLKINSSTEVN